MKENVFIYFPGCISFRNMLTFEAQGCRFTFEVVFNHALALKFLLCSESGLHRSCSFSEYLHTVHSPWDFFYFLLHCMSQKSEFWGMEIQNIETGLWTSTSEYLGQDAFVRVFLFLSDRSSLGLLWFVQTCCGTVASSNFSPLSSPVLNTLTHPIPADIPPPATLPHPRPISPHFWGSS